jgi:ribonuclease P protein component
MVATPPAVQLPSGRLPRTSRLRRRQEFRRTMRSGRRAKGPHFVVVVQPGAPDACSRLGLAVARAAGHAPARARLRRLLRDAFRCVRADLLRPQDVVVMAEVAWPDARLGDVTAELAALLRQVRALPATVQAAASVQTTATP